MSTYNRVIALRFEALTKTLKQKLLLQNVFQSLPWVLVAIFIVYWFSISSHYLLAVLSLIVVVRLLILKKSRRYQEVTVENIALHLNRQYQNLEESTQLFLTESSDFSPLQILQKQRITPRLYDILKKNNDAPIPRLVYRSTVHLSLFVIAAGIVISFVSHSLFPTTAVEKQADYSRIEQTKNTVLEVETVNVTIVAPEYTALKSQKSNALNIELIEGAVIRWQLTFNDDQQDYFIKFADGTLNQLLQQNDKSYVLEKSVHFTGIYQIVTPDKTLAKVYTLTVIKDKKPRIRIVTPKKTITEIAKNGSTDLITKVQISDDFDISKVEILASIAKGSGESVKFRDQVFSFDSKEILDGIELYQKHWQLTSLGMEPGDELYFTIKAWDNRQPQAQMTRSATKIVRWLEDEEQGVLSDGILIDFMPEYFKSQRQIIIETIELIDDKKELSKDRFDETSELLGIAQSDLKEKYGQYLGDEVEDGGGGHAISAAASEGIEQASHDKQLPHDNQGAHDDDEQHNMDSDGAVGHEHQAEHSANAFSMKSFGNDRSGLNDNIARFGHNHEDADIGVMGRQDPKALMKRSISNMWQAELHLMLSEPKKALPFEQEALKYLKMAKKAERIYVKRLGFEPPPVSEQRRYQGDLDDILSYQHSQIFDLRDNEKKPLYDLYKYLNEQINLPDSKIEQANEQLNIPQRKLIQTVKSIFEELLVKRPALIKMVAILERMLLANSFHLTECLNCPLDPNSIVQLSDKIWQLLPAVTAMPSVRREAFADGDSLFKKYTTTLVSEPKPKQLGSEQRDKNQPENASTNSDEMLRSKR